MKRASLFPALRRKTLESLNGYLQADDIIGRIDKYIVPPRLGGDAGILGAIAPASKITKN